jgi:hypothetical protein
MSRLVYNFFLEFESPGIYTKESQPGFIKQIRFLPCRRDFHALALQKFIISAGNTVARCSLKTAKTPEVWK